MTTKSIGSNYRSIIGKDGKEKVVKVHRYKTPMAKYAAKTKKTWRAAK